MEGGHATSVKLLKKNKSIFEFNCLHIRGYVQEFMYTYIVLTKIQHIPYPSATRIKRNDLWTAL